MKHICFVMHRFAGGGAEKITITLANELVRRNYRVTFLVKFEDGEFISKLSNEINVIGMTESKKTPINFMLFLKQEFEQSKYDCVFSVSLGMSTVAVLANYLSKTTINLVPVIHNSMSMTEDSYKKIKFAIMKYFDKFTYSTVVVSEDAKKEYLQCTHIPSQKVTTIYNPVDINEVKEKMNQEPRHEWLIDKEIPVIVSAGRLSIAKNYPFMLEVMKELLKYQQARLIILGKGEMLEELIQYAKKLKIEEYVDFHGFTQNPYTYFKNADCFLMTSDYEGLPTVMIEALACGSTVVSTDCISGPREILENGKYGHLIPIGDKDKMVQALIETLRKKNIDRDHLRGRANYFSVNKAVSRYVELIEGLSNDKKN